tara:strand:+ start:430 stop:558 length:129 start_codon:yes stop_codon:yes gene_type:complete
MEAYNLPIKLRRWFLERLLKQKEDENEAMEKAAENARKQHSR